MMLSILEIARFIANIYLDNLSMTTSYNSTTSTDNSKTEESILSFVTKSNDHRQASWWIWQRRNSRTVDGQLKKI